MAADDLSTTDSRYVATPWSLRTWRPVLWQVRSSLDAGFQHLNTRVIYTEVEGNRPQGQTLWLAHALMGDAAMAWDWVQIAHGVVAIADPLSLVSNMQFVSEQGRPLSALESTLILNEFVRSLPWQQEVHRALRATLN